ncbi:MAG: glucokinase [Pseudomonadota bacterium]
MTNTDAILVADIGGTNARFAVARPGPAGANNLLLENSQTFRAEDFETVRDAADAFLESITEKPARACFAVAGPVDAAVIRFTNSPWQIDRARIRDGLKLDQFHVVNDFEALACGIGTLSEGDTVCVHDAPGDPAAPTLVLGPGTGLGQALLVPIGGETLVIATEGGHKTFAPRTDEQVEVMRFIAREHPRVSVERLLSGRGLVNIHRALCSISGTQRISLQADEITRAAIEETYPIAQRAVALFCAILGDVAGDAVLSSGARGGVMLGGGILPRIKDLFLASDFAAHFTDKGRMRPYLEGVPVRLIMRDGVALLGAGALALKAR